MIFFCKGQIEQRAGLAHHRFSQKRTNEFDLFAVKSKKANETNLFAVKSKKANETNLFVRFLGESTAHKSAFGFI